MTIYYCDQCKSEDIEVTNITPQRQPEERKPMSEFMGAGAGIMNAVHIIQTWVIRCRKCGNRKEISQ